MGTGDRSGVSYAFEILARVRSACCLCLTIRPGDPHVVAVGHADGPGFG